MPNIKAQVIPEPEEGKRTVFNLQFAPAIHGEGEMKGDVSIQCGNYGVTLIDTIKLGAIRNIVVKCPECGSFNDIPY